MTPVYKHPSHMEKEKTSIVFDAKEPGKEIARFYGDEHKENSEDFCRRFRAFDSELTRDNAQKEIQP